MENDKYSRKKFIKQSSMTGLGAITALSLPIDKMFSAFTKRYDTPALLGGEPIVSYGWPSWPVWNPQKDEDRLLEVMRSGVWSRDKVVDEFEQKWAETVGTNRSLAVVNGTNALEASLHLNDVGWGDEVITTPYSFIASVIPILSVGAIPVFADVDPDTFQIAPDKIKDKITSKTKAILPVHMFGIPANMERIMDIAEDNNLLVVEDACQAHIAEFDHQKVGAIGDAGCFSYQNSKVLPIGEGGAIVSDDNEFMDRCYSYHNYGMAYGSVGKGARARPFLPGTKLRMAEYQAAIGLAQLKRLEEQTVTRNQNAEYLRSLFNDIPGIIPYKLYDQVTRTSLYKFPIRYKQEKFKGLSRSKFLKALRAEGVPCNDGYYNYSLSEMPYLENAFKSSSYKKFYSEDKLNYEAYIEQNECPITDRLCKKEGIWLRQNILLGSKKDMDKIAMAIDKIAKNAEKLKSQ